ncbi:hypothetical protein [Magnetococcus sp. PR-3]|uniref:hypothetical protein n=1 Tax=Magnetococcus sp. PR-3 TaxID=3120355 RepID=UPI002FCDE85C
MAAPWGEHAYDQGQPQRLVFFDGCSGMAAPWDEHTCDQGQPQRLVFFYGESQMEEAMETEHGTPWQQTDPSTPEAQDKAPEQTPLYGDVDGADQPETTADPAQTSDPQAPLEETGFTPPEPPEGMQLNPEQWQQWQGVFEQAGLDQQTVDKLSGEGAPLIQQMVEKGVEAALPDAVMAQRVAQTKADMQQVQADKEVGGREMKKHLAVAVKVIDRYGQDGLAAELKKSLDESGMGNNPHLIKLLHRIGKATVQEDGFDHAPHPAQVTTQSMADEQYPNM